MTSGHQCLFVFLWLLERYQSLKPVFSNIHCRMACVYTLCSNVFFKFYFRASFLCVMNQGSINKALNKRQSLTRSHAGFSSVVLQEDDKMQYVEMIVSCHFVHIV